MSEPEIVAGILLLALTAYAVLAGADFGGGVWDLLASGPRARDQRRAVAEAMGPVWEANHVWLIFMIVGLFTAFPSAFARLSLDLYVPFTIALIGIVLRGAAFAFRAHGREAAGDASAWGLAFGAASIVAPFSLAIGLAAVASASADRWATPFGVLLGVFAVSLCAYLAATYLTVEAEGTAPLDIINGPLMAGMSEVGRLFNANELIVAEVLQSAEAMKAAVSHLEQFMEKADTAKRGKIVLATVKGDVHDIGKNLVEIILKNNGYDVVNLGIKVPPEELIKAFQEHQPDAIGLSGLLVKSAQQMVVTASDLKDAGIEIPLLVGGAALSGKFTQQKIAPCYGNAVCYAKDAMTGLRLMNELMDPATRATVLRDHTSSGDGVAVTTTVRVTEIAPVARSPKVRTDLPIEPVGYLERKVRLVPDLREVWSYINPFMLYGRHLGFRGDFEKHLAARDAKAVELFEGMEEVKTEAAKWMKVKAVWQFFEAEAKGEALNVFAPGEKAPLHTWNLKRQRTGDRLCLSDYVLPAKDGKRDHVALFVATAGEGVRERAEAAKNAGYYFLSHGLQALAIETAEACAEWLHRRIREDWGFPDPAGITMAQRFTSRYRGKRYSFGYPACPELADQAGIWKLLKPEEIGVQLTEGFMMDPEASVSALAFIHPDCTYFSVGESVDGG